MQRTIIIKAYRGCIDGFDDWRPVPAQTNMTEKKRVEELESRILELKQLNEKAAEARLHIRLPSPFFASLRSSCCFAVVQLERRSRCTGDTRTGGLTVAHVVNIAAWPPSHLTGTARSGGGTCGAAEQHVRPAGERDGLPSVGHARGGLHPSSLTASLAFTPSKDGKCGVL